jgi:putative membrane protein
MLIDRSYRVTEFLLWTRRAIYLQLAISTVVVVLYQVVGLHWLAIPWGIVFLLGTTVALSAGFKNLQTYNRNQDAQLVWCAIWSGSRAFGLACRDLIPDAWAGKRLVSRHLGWLATLRHEMRQPKPWEASEKPYNVEYRRHYDVPEHAQSLPDELARYLVADEAALVLESHGKPYQVLALQSADAARLLGEGVINASAFAELQRATREFNDLQGKTERIKNYPYPRQHAFIHAVFVRILCVLLPFGMVSELERLHASSGGWAVWLAIPLSALIGWMYAALDQVGEATENPFEGGANDIPISEICDALERDLHEAWGERASQQREHSRSGFAL